MSARLRFLAPLLTAAALLVASPATAADLAGSSGPLSVTMHAGTHHPKANHNWWITVTASLNGRAATASATYQFLYNGSVVGTSYPKCPQSQSVCVGQYRFHGGFRDNLMFPPRGVGVPLTFRLVVSAGGHTVYIPYAVTTIR